MGLANFCVSRGRGMAVFIVAALSVLLWSCESEEPTHGLFKVERTGDAGVDSAIVAIERAYCLSQDRHVLDSLYRQLVSAANRSHGLDDVVEYYREVL